MKKLLCIFLLFITVCAHSQNVTSFIKPSSGKKAPKELTQEKLSSLADKSVVQIETAQKIVYDVEPFKLSNLGNVTGTGFVYNFKGEKVVITNAHVAKSFYSKSVIRKPSLTGEIPKKYDAELLFITPDFDLAMLRVKDKTFFDGLEALELGETPSAGESVMTIGFPAGTSSGSAVNLYKTFTIMNRATFTQYSFAGTGAEILALQLTGAIMPGISGGPVLNSRGQVIGVSFQHAKAYEQQGYAIPSLYLDAFLRDCADGKNEGPFTMGVWGASKGPANYDYREMLGVPKEDGGALLFNVTEATSIFHSGIRNGDIITKIDSYQLLPNHNIIIPGLGEFPFAAYLAKFIAGDSVTFEYYSRSNPGKAMKSKVVLREKIDITNGSKKDEDLPFITNGGIIFAEHWSFSYKQNDTAKRKKIVISTSYGNNLPKTYWNYTLLTVNNDKITDIESLKKAFEKNADFYLLEIESNDFNGVYIAIDNRGDELKNFNKQTMDKFEIPKEAFLPHLLP
ncbi:S1-C subfamily serine protease [Elusimicrobium posterum]|uniref:S1C family serine protease n=1 Tax=Elusimicrobium posterum TaxID=3116653 RepID=UPI003C723B25